MDLILVLVRRELVQYLVKKGADLDAVGGELMSTPLHWATRQNTKTKQKYVEIVL